VRKGSKKEESRGEKKQLRAFPSPTEKLTCLLKKQKHDVKQEQQKGRKKGRKKGKKLRNLKK